MKYKFVTTLTLSLAGLGLAAASSGSSQEDLLTVHDVVALSEVDEIAIAPDGKTVAYTLEVPRRPGHDEDGESWHELYVVPEGGEPRPFVTGTSEVSAIALTPDGREITFLDKRNGKKALHAIALAGGEARRLAPGAAVKSYDLCSDGKALALVVPATESADHQRLKAQGFNQKIFEEDWLPDHLRITSRESNATRTVAIEGSVQSATWNPDCSRLAVVVAPTSLVDDTLVALEIHVVDPSSGAIIASVEHTGKLGDLAWSPDGTRLAFVGAEDEHDPAAGRLMVADAGGGAPRDLLPGLLGHVRTFAWDGADRLVFLVHERTASRLGAVGVDGSGAETRIAPGTVVFTELRRAASGDLALIGNTAGHPAEAFHLATGDGTPRRLSHSNPRLDEVRLAVQEVVTYKARDGLELDGILVRPLDEEAGRHYPLIVIVHGGPESHISNGWVTTYARPGQSAAARGFAAFYPNYRASTGRGVEFSKLDHGDPAGKEFDDIVDGVDHLIASGLVDRDKVAITGNSYGGYATAWGATYYSERFAAAVMAVGISERIAKFGTSDIPKELYLVHERMYPWEEFQVALERSPVYHVEKARTPILILHGEKDTRVFPGQSRTLYRFLKILGQAPVRLVLYPEEGHGNKRAAARLDFGLRQLRWIEHYLQGPGGEPPPRDIDYGLGSPSEPQAPQGHEQ